MAIAFDYGPYIRLDAEDLAEAGIGAAYRHLLPELRKYVPHPLCQTDQWQTIADRIQRS